MVKSWKVRYAQERGEDYNSQSLSFIVVGSYIFAFSVIKIHSFRWFVLQGSRLYYFRDRETDTPIGDLYLRNCSTRISTIDNKPNCFELCVPQDERGNLVMFAKDEVERDGWMEALEKAGQSSALCSAPRSVKHQVCEKILLFLE
tara:strand:- start:1101 stop:1535 length:435 start_codon:yes stop_codon:yes gene_type:complete